MYQLALFGSDGNEFDQGDVDRLVRIFPSNDCEEEVAQVVEVVDVVDVVGRVVVVGVVEVVGVVVDHVLVDVVVLAVVVGVAAAMTEVGSDVATVAPFLLLAVTDTRNVVPVSFAPRS
jgi:hypothetical protein